MTDPLFDVGDGNTPLDDDEADGLKPTWVRTRGDLNDAERDNILEARRAIRSATVDEVLDDLWLRQLHQRMFGDVWTWAGRYRTTLRNIGIDPPLIAGGVRALADDCRWWIEHDEPGLVVARFHHRLVAVHPFPNGNGRHSRAAADYLAGALVPLSADLGIGLGLRCRFASGQLPVGSANRGSGRRGSRQPRVVHVVLGAGTSGLGAQSHRPAGNRRRRPR